MPMPISKCGIHQELAKLKHITALASYLKTSNTDVGNETTNSN